MLPLSRSSSLSLQQSGGPFAPPAVTISALQAFFKKSNSINRQNDPDARIPASVRIQAILRL